MALVAAAHLLSSPSLPSPLPQVADYWVPGKAMLANGKELLDSMFNFDKDNIPEKIIDALQPYVTNEEFTPKKIESASKACTAMCQVRP